MSVYEQVKQALQDVVAPELKSLQVEIKSLRSEIASEIRRLETEIKRLDEKIDSLDDKLNTSIQIRERLASLEAKLAAMGHS
jgi:predicted nuclease with TOPRIM domain